MNYELRVMSWLGDLDIYNEETAAGYCKNVKIIEGAATKEGDYRYNPTDDL